MGPFQSFKKEDLVSELTSSPVSSGSSGGSSPSMSPGVSLVSAIVPALINMFSSMWANSRNERLVARQNQANIEQWRRENAYNTPAAQMQRLLSAGINPAMAYANGDLMNEAAASPQLDSARVTSPIQIDPLTAAQVANLEAQTESIQHQTSREDQKQGLTLQTMQAELSKIGSEIFVNNATEKLNRMLGKEAGQRYENLALQWQRDNETLEDYIRKFHADTNMSVTESHYAAERLSSAIDSALAYADYLVEQTKYVSFDAKTGRIVADNGTAQVKVDAFRAGADLQEQLRNWHLNVRRLQNDLMVARVQMQKMLSEKKSIDQKRFGDILNQYVKAYTDLKNANANMLRAIGEIIPG